MNLSLEQKNSIIEKHKKLESIKPILKEDFMGIDSTIDQIVDAMRPFYIFPETLKRPLVINLWGMTGVGKTSLIERIVDLLELNHQYCKFDIGEYVGDTSDHKIRFALSEKVEKCRTKHVILALDEFQFGRTIDENGKEIDRASLRPIWDVIDSGVITSIQSKSYRVIEILCNLLKAVEQGVVVENGIVTKGENIYNEIFHSTYVYECDFAQNEVPQKIAWFEDTSGAKFGNSYTHLKFLKNPYFIKKSHFDTFYGANPSVFKDLMSFNLNKDIFRDGKNAEEIIKFIEKAFIFSVPLMKKEDYSQSIIFCLGNIDEAYSMTHSMNPDADADIFHEHSLKISLPKMKEALSKRYRMEQIGRLGNTHIIYPSFNKDTYNKIIDKSLQKRISECNEKFGVNLEFDPSMKDIIYKEGVFPTQGARPVLSTVSSMIDSYIASIISDVALNCPTYNYINWKFEDGEHPKYIIKVQKNKRTTKDSKTFEYQVKLNVEQLRKSDFSERQTQVAVHEAGHAIAAIMQMGLVPSETRSRTAGNGEGITFVKLPDIETKTSMYNAIVMCLAGLEAEKFVFGEDVMSSGGGSDLTHATTLATSMIKTYGMGENVIQISTPSPLNSSTICSPESIKNSENQAIEIVKKAQIDVQKCIKENKEFLYELSEFLAKNPTILEEDLKIMARKYTKKPFKDPENYYGFKETLSLKSKNTLNRKVTTNNKTSVAVFSDK